MDRDGVQQSANISANKCRLLEISLEKVRAWCEKFGILLPERLEERLQERISRGQVLLHECTSCIGNPNLWLDRAAKPEESEEHLSRVLDDLLHAFKCAVTNLSNRPTGLHFHWKQEAKDLLHFLQSTRQAAKDRCNLLIVNVRSDHKEGDVAPSEPPSEEGINERNVLLMEGDLLSAKGASSTPVLTVHVPSSSTLGLERDIQHDVKHEMDAQQKEVQEDEASLHRQVEELSALLQACQSQLSELQASQTLPHHSQLVFKLRTRLLQQTIRRRIAEHRAEHMYRQILNLCSETRRDLPQVALYPRPPQEITGRIPMGEYAPAPLRSADCFCGAIVDGTGGYFLSCGHIFHLACLATTMVSKANCPMCRAKIPESTYSVLGIEDMWPGDDRRGHLPQGTTPAGLELFMRSLEIDTTEIHSDMFEPYTLQWLPVEIERACEQMRTLEVAPVDTLTVANNSSSYPARPSREAITSVERETRADWMQRVRLDWYLWRARREHMLGRQLVEAMAAISHVVPGRPDLVQVIEDDLEDRANVEEFHIDDDLYLNIHGDDDQDSDILASQDDDGDDDQDSDIPASQDDDGGDDQDSDIPASQDDDGDDDQYSDRHASQDDDEDDDQDSDYHSFDEDDDRESNYHPSQD